MMKKIVLLICALAFTASTAFGQQISDAGFISGINPSDPQNIPTGGYFIVPGIGNAGGFFIGGGPFVDSNIDGLTENIGPDLATGSVLSSDTITLNSAPGLDNTLLTIMSDSGDLAPAGLADGGGLPLDTLALFVGANAGGTPITFTQTVVAANLDAFDGTGASVFGGPVDLVPLGFDIQGGSFGVSFGAGTAGVGIDTITLSIDTVAVPEPSSAVLGMVALAGLGLLRRRR